jgi:hypothetical protein
MRRIRRHLIAFACAALACQAGALGGAAAVIGFAAGDADGSALVCTCTHAPGGECPMHKPKTPTTPRRGWSAGCQDGVDVALMLLHGAAAVLVRPAPSAGGLAAAARLAATRETVVARAHPPLSPPPRLDRSSAC